MNLLGKLIVFGIIIIGGLMFLSTLISGALGTNLLHYYNLNEPSGNALDSAGSLNGIVLETPSRSVFGLLGTAYHFNGNVGGGRINITDGFSNGGLQYSAWTLNMWVKVNNTAIDNGARPFGTLEDSRGAQILQAGAGTWALLWQSNTSEIQLTVGDQVEEEWQMLTAIGNATTLRWIVNNSQSSEFVNTNVGTHYNFTNVTGLNFGSLITDGVGANRFFGSIDEIGFWGRDLTPSEVTELYNSGAGIDPTFDLNVALNSPKNNSEVISLTNFNASLNPLSSPSVLNLTNATLDVWYINGTFIFNNFTLVTGNITNNSLFNNIDLGNHVTLPRKLLWNVNGEAINTTDTIISRSSNNFTLTSGYNISSELFPTSTSEGNTELYEINISLGTGAVISFGNLYFNNTKFTGTLTNPVANNWTLTTSLDIPQFENNYNISNFWDIQFDNGFKFNTTSRTTEVLALGIDDCSTHNVVILNYTLRDEENKSSLGGVPYNTSIEVDLDISPIGDDGSNPIIEYNHTYTQVNPAQICVKNDVLNGTSFRLDSTARYSSLNRVVEFHNIQKFTLNNETIPQTIDLYDLLSTDSQEFLITFKDTSFLPVKDALIDVTRNYVGDGVFRTVEIPKTNIDGQALTHLVLGDVVYTIIVRKENVILGTFDNIVPFCTDLSTGDCQISLNAFISKIDLEDFTTSSNLTYVFDFDKNARTIQVTFTTLDGVSRIGMNGTLFDHLGNNTFCNEAVTTSSGSLTCNIPMSIGNTTVVADLWNDNIFVTRAFFSLQENSEDLFGLTGTLMLILLYITIPLMLITTGVGVVIGAVLGLVFGSLLNLYVGGGIIGAGATILWFIIAGAILIWKINDRGKGGT